MSRERIKNPHRVEIVENFSENKLQKKKKKNNQKEFTIEKVIKKKGDKLYVRWKGQNNSFKRCNRC